jgi:hypothetical protein
VNPGLGAAALAALGELYRDEEGREVWRIRTPDGSLYAEGVASDHDAQWLAEQAIA